MNHHLYMYGYNTYGDDNQEPYIIQFTITYVILAIDSFGTYIHCFFLFSIKIGITKLLTFTDSTYIQQKNLS